jgi:mRNA interferase MazF
MKKGDIVLIPFPFTDLTGNKTRPAVVLIESEEDVTVCFITSQLNYRYEYDILIQPATLNGLKKPSIIRLSKLATIDKELVIGLLGNLDDHYLDLINKTLSLSHSIPKSPNVEETNT